MRTNKQHRRMFLKTVLGGAVAQCLPVIAHAQSGYRTRLEWQHFKKTTHYQSFLNALAAMRANTNPANRGSLQFWANVHVNHCPHGTPYFIAWHRGYLHFFEQQLQLVSGDPGLNLPYWDYYAYGTMPAEFTSPAPGNPLYLPRTSTNVHGALDLSPFAPGVYNFQRGMWNAFEPKLENIHNPVHDLIGGIMSTMQSPLDPIFYLHHANIDRLTHAWALPNGKGIPLSAFPYAASNSDPYWAGTHVYASDLSLDRFLTLIPTWLGNDYEHNNVPASLPPPPAAARTASATQAAGTAKVTRRPPLRPSVASQGRVISQARRSLGGAIELPLDEQSATIQLRFGRDDGAELARVLAARRNGRQAGRQANAGSVKIVFDRALVEDAGRLGGYFYALYVNMPASIDTPAARTRSFIGTLGPFQVASASHHGPARLEFDVSELGALQDARDGAAITLSWVRVDGDKPPAGRTIRLGEVRLELAFEPEPVQAAPLPKPPGWYR